MTKRLGKGYVPPNEDESDSSELDQMDSKDGPTQE